MTGPKSLALVRQRIAEWQAAEIIALGERDVTRARECRLRACVLEQLAHDLTEEMYEQTQST